MPRRPLSALLALLALAVPPLTACAQGTRSGGHPAPPEAGEAAPSPLNAPGPWSGAEMAAAAAALEAMLEADPASLPRLAGPDGGARFARLTDHANVDRFASPDVPLRERLDGLGAQMTPYADVLDVYGRAYMRTRGYAAEIPDLLGVSLHGYAVTLAAMGEAERSPGADTSLISPALREARELAYQLALTALGAVGAPSNLDAEARGRLVDHLTAEAPALAAGLGADWSRRLAEAVRVVRERVGEPGLARRLQRVGALLAAPDGGGE